MRQALTVVLLLAFGASCAAIAGLDDYGEGDSGPGGADGEVADDGSHVDAPAANDGQMVLDSGPSDTGGDARDSGAPDTTADAPPTMPSFVGFIYSTSTGTQVSVGPPPGTVDGDLLLAGLECFSPSAPAAQTGWPQVASSGPSPDGLASTVWLKHSFVAGEATYTFACPAGAPDSYVGVLGYRHAAVSVVQSSPYATGMVVTAKGPAPSVQTVGVLLFTFEPAMPANCTLDAPAVTRSSPSSFFFFGDDSLAPGQTVWGTLRCMTSTTITFAVVGLTGA